MPQQTANNRLGSRQALIAMALALIILCPLGYSVVRGISTQGAEPPEPPDPKHTSCIVAPSRGITSTEDMRLRHWELLTGIREEIVRYGKRGEIGLGRCRDCHTSRVRFCYRCHESASVKPDCWGCHYYP